MLQSPVVVTASNIPLLRVTIYAKHILAPLVLVDLSISDIFILLNLLFPLKINDKLDAILRTLGLSFGKKLSFLHACLCLVSLLWNHRFILQVFYTSEV